MATQQELLNLLNSLILDNNTNQVTPAKVRAVLTAIISELGITDTTTTTATAPLVLDPFDNNFSIQKATELNDGYLAKEDFVKFNSFINNYYPVVSKFQLVHKSTDNLNNRIELNDLAKGFGNDGNYWLLARFKNYTADNNVNNPANYEVLFATGLISE